MRIFEPNRGNYKRKYTDNDSCPFCGTEEVIECKELSGTHWRVLVNQFPFMDGNLMIVPKTHYEQIHDLPKEVWEELHEVFIRTQDILGEVFGVSSWNIAMNVGPEAGGSIAHIHWQIIPRKQKNMTSVGIFADLHVITISPEEVRDRIKEAVEKGE